MIKKLHYSCGLILLTFVVAHLINHLISLSGVDQHISFMSNLRSFYYNPIIEIPFLLFLITQLISGVILSYRKRNNELIIWEKLQIISGIYLALFLIIHVSAVLVGRYYLKLDTNIYFAIAGLNNFPHYIFFIPYYYLAISSFFIHLASIHYSKTRVIFGISKNLQAILIIVLGFFIAFLIIYGMTNRFKGAWHPPQYNILIGK